MTLFILHVGYEVTGEIAHHLMDGVDESDVEAARRAALAVPGVEEATVRARWMGRSLRVDIEAKLAPAVTLETAEVIGAKGEASVRAAVPAARHVRFVPRAGM